MTIPRVTIGITIVGIERVAPNMVEATEMIVEGEAVVVEEVEALVVAIEVVIDVIVMIGNHEEMTFNETTTDLAPHDDEIGETAKRKTKKPNQRRTPRSGNETMNKMVMAKIGQRKQRKPRKLD
jgi:hypothetical protein